MTLKHNILANYVSQAFVTLTGIVTVPMCIQYMGVEAFGLVGFFAMLQACFQLLDIGLTPTISRESACYHGGAMSAVEYRKLFRSLSVIFISIAVTGGSALFLMANIMSERWLNLRGLSSAEVLGALQIMAACVALRWIGGLYRGVISGGERFVWLGGFNAAIAALRFMGVFATMMVFGFTPMVYFWHQLVVAALETIALLLMCYALLPNTDEFDQPIGWSFRPIRPLLRFSLTIAFTSSVWVLLTQTDKLVLSGILTLSDYGYFTLAVLVASSVLLATSPVGTVILPRLARHYAEGDNNKILQIYNHATQLVTVIASSLTVTLVVCCDSLLFAWTGSAELTKATSSILQLYAVGNGFLALSAFPFYLQYARGNLRYHLIGNIVMVIVLIPTIIVVASKIGGVGAGGVWAGMNVLYFLGWVGYVHAKLVPGLHWKWLKSIFAVLLPTLLVGLILGYLQPKSQSRLFELVSVIIIASTCVLIATISSPLLRKPVLERGGRLFKVVVLRKP